MATNGDPVSRSFKGSTPFEYSKSFKKRTTTERKRNRIKFAEDKNQAAVDILQEAIRCKIIGRTRLHCANLAERLLFESSVVWETGRFVNQVLVFALLLGALSLSSDEAQRRGIFENLKNSFDFNTMESIKNRQEFVQEGLPIISRASKDYFLLSSNYFDSNGAGSRQLIRDVIAFSAPVSVGQHALSGSQFSFTSWIRTDPSFLKGYILQKPTGAGLSCWGWHLHSSMGPELHYGGHDYFPTPDSTTAEPSEQRQIQLGPRQQSGFASGEFALLTVVVDADKVWFYHNTKLLNPEGTPLPAPLSDCFNDGTGVVTGDAGMEVGDLRFHPTALTATGIDELYFNGGSLGDLSTGSQPDEHVISDFEALDGSITSTIGELGESHDKSQVINDINFVIDRSPPAEWRTPAAPTGTIWANATAIADPAIGRSYHSLYVGPGRLTETQSESDHRYIRGHPSFAGSGMTLAFWYRHRECTAASGACGLYFLAAYDSTGTAGVGRKCWSLWLERTKLWFDNPRGDPSGQYPPFGIPERFNLNRDQFWRHIAVVWNEQTDHVDYYMDGAFVVSTYWGGTVSTASCAGDDTRISFGHQDPGYTYGAEVEVYDFRMFTHGASGPLQPADIAALAEQKTPPSVAPEYKCIHNTDPRFEETEWLDAYGHDCSWYAENAKRFPALCNFPKASSMCPISCSSRQECWAHSESIAAYYSWTGIKRIEPTLDSASGALCLAGQTTKEDVVKECEEWVASGGAQGPWESSDWYLSFKAEGGTEDRRGERLDLRDCEQIARAVTEQCRINATAVEEFTRESQANNGDFTITFWLRPLGESSLNNYSDSYIPHLQFLSSLSPPTHNLAVGLWANPNGEARYFSACEEEKFDNIEFGLQFKEASSDGWTFFAISRKNIRGDVTGEGATLTNVGKWWEGSPWEKPQCLYNPDAFFSALEVNYASLMSPIMMVPAYMPASSLQRMFQESVLEMKGKSGAASGSAERAGIPVAKKTYAQPLILVAPPIIFQTRAEPAVTCPSKFGEDMINNQHQHMLKTQCAFPFQCDESLRASPTSLLACAGDQLKDRKQFGLEPSDFGGERGYADFLASVTEPVFLVRDDELFETKDFVDTMTQMVQVLLVFWSPEASTTTVMTVHANFGESSSAQVDVSVEHYELLEGRSLDVYVIVQILVLVNVAIMVMDIAVSFKDTFLRVVAEQRAAAEEEAHILRERAEQAAQIQSLSTFPAPSPTHHSRGAMLLRRQTGEQSKLGEWLFVVRGVVASLQELVKDLVDAVIACLVILYVAWRIPGKIASASNTADTVGGLSVIDWGNRQLTREFKVSEFFESMNALEELIREEGYLDKFCNFVLILSLLRLIKCTSMHPRLALLQGTLVKAWDDLWHAAILIVLLMLCFGGIGTWRFGGYREDFSDLQRTCQTLFMMTFGEFPEAWNENMDLQLYTVLYFMLVFLLVQNFLLAVIVEAYMGVRRDNEALETEQEFVSDIVSSYGAHWRAYQHGWPTPHKLGEELTLWKARFSIGFEDLWDTNWFSSRASVVEFVKHYRIYDFNKPTPFDEYGPEPKEEQEKLAHALEIRLCNAMGLRIQTLKEFASEQLRIAQERRDRKTKATQEDPSQPATGAIQPVLSEPCPTDRVGSAAMTEGSAKGSAASDAGSGLNDLLQTRAVSMQSTNGAEPSRKLPQRDLSRPSNVARGAPPVFDITSQDEEPTPAPAQATMLHAESVPAASGMPAVPVGAGLSLPGPSALAGEGDGATRDGTAPLVLAEFLLDSSSASESRDPPAQ